MGRWVEGRVGGWMDKHLNDHCALMGSTHDKASSKVSRSETSHHPWVVYVGGSAGNSLFGG